MEYFTKRAFEVRILDKGNSCCSIAANVVTFGNGIKFDTAQQWSDIAVTVSFIQECTFDMTVLGRAVID